MNVSAASPTPQHLCYHCGGVLNAGDFFRQDQCPSCRRDTRVCKNCRHYERGAHNDCRENQADRVVDKERANFCDYFSAVAGAPSGQPKPPTAQDLKNKADALFKKKT